MKFDWMRMSVSLVVLAVTLPALAQEPAEEKPSAVTESVATTPGEQLFASATALRQRMQLPVQTPHPALMAEAQAWAEHLVRVGRLVHAPNRPEIIAYAGGGFSAEAAVQMWHDSGPHRALMLGRWSHCGYGAAYDPQTGRTYYCGVFGTNWAGSTERRVERRTETTAVVENGEATAVVSSYTPRRGLFRRRK